MGRLFSVVTKQLPNQLAEEFCVFSFAPVFTLIMVLGLSLKGHAKASFLKRGRRGAG